MGCPFPGDMQLFNSESILTSVKKWIGLDESFPAFDPDVIMAINGWLMTLRQLGVNIPASFRVTGATNTWSEMLGERADLESVKTWLYIKARLTFDPPSTSFVIKALEDQAKELEWRLNIQEDTPASNPVEREEIYVF